MGLRGSSMYNLEQDLFRPRDVRSGGLRANVASVARGAIVFIF